jgi:hypothetical protein
VTVNFATANGSARKNDNDYVAKNGKLTFAPGETSKTITISVKGDRKSSQMSRSSSICRTPRARFLATLKAKERF